MKHIRNLWNLLKQEISLWKYEKQELVKGICYIVMIAWLFFDRIAFAILLIPYLFVFMKQQRIHKVHREKEKLRKEFREMMISIGNSLSAGYSIENALKTAKNDLEMYEEHTFTVCGQTILLSNAALADAISVLPEQTREEILRYYFLRQPQRVIGACIGRSRSTAGRHIQLALQRLREEMGVSRYE